MSKILILDDNIELSLHWRELLEAYGYVVECQANANITVEQIHALNVDLIILDMFFQQIDGLQLRGLEFLEQLESLPQGQKPRILAVSGQNMEGSILEVAQLYGVDLTLKKPIEPRLLIESVTHLIQMEASDAVK